MAVKSKDLYPAIFSRHADAYQRRLEQIMSRGEARGRQRVIDLVDARPGMRILDLACGPGTLSRPLAALVAPDGEVVGVDLALGMLERARLGGIVNARFELMDIEELAFADASFDAAVCGHGLQFAPHVDRTLDEARRVLRRGGRFAASVPVSGIRQSVTALLDSVVDRWLPPPPHAVDESGTRRLVADQAAFEAAALSAGFDSARVEVIEERVRWESAEQLVALCTSWWDCAARLDEIDTERRDGFIDDALTTMRRDFPGPIETSGRTHVLYAVAP